MAAALMASQAYVDRKFEELKELLKTEGEGKKAVIKSGPILLRGLQFVGHPILHDLKLNFCDDNGVPQDTIILAGENGTGKSTVINALNDVLSRRHGMWQKIIFEVQSQAGVRIIEYDCHRSQGGSTMIDIGVKDLSGDQCECAEFNYSKTIYSDVDINFKGGTIDRVTSMELDSTDVSMRSSPNLATEIKQLIVDIQSLDDASTAQWVKNNVGKGKSIDDVPNQVRMSRLAKAFDYMFTDLKYDRIENRDNHKVIIFKKCGIDVSIDALSSGEKQIVYRGCFMLRNINALTGAFVFIDEPEISMHPEWQKKILNFYKRIFTTESGIQTSQIFVVTHSPFIIHNENRYNDKVIVLERDEDNHIIVKDKPEYYRCDSVEAVSDAFHVDLNVQNQRPVVYVEGRTDEKYFSEAAAVFGIELPFVFQWIGHVGENGQERNTGDKALTHAASYFKAHNPPVKVVIQYDCDKKHDIEQQGNLIIRSVTEYLHNVKKCKRGTENALVLDRIDDERWDTFFERKEEDKGYGKPTIIQELRKTELCDYICALPDEDKKHVFANLKTEIETLIGLMH